ncbi:putative F-box protein At1g30920 [Prunus persica]|uniref:putative F-box protein At1g30920 n=1 Tax=Prunus persica TaxID=3760 RepID=UPI0009AB3530|nr:putative F-box protein At1g30920 [Prunus persica]
MDALPPEILIDILSRLPVNSICCIRCVSKALLKMVDDLSFATLDMRRRFLTTCSTPRLVVLNESSYDKYDMLYPVTYDGHYLLTKSKDAIVSYFESKRRFYSFAFVFCNLFGFTGLNPKRGRSCLLVNPFKGEVLMLPSASDVQVPANCLCTVDMYSMGFDNITNSFKVLRVSTNKKDYLAAEVLVLGKSSWRELPTVPPCFPTYKSVYAHGDMHCLVYGDYASSARILSFDFKKEEFYLTPLPTPLEKDPDLWKCLHLINFRGSMALVYASSPEDEYVKMWGYRQCVEVWGLKNCDNKEWELKYKIDTKQDLPIHWEHTSFSKCGEWDHGIYLNQEGSFNNCIFFVHLGDGSMECVLLKGQLIVHSCTGSMISLNNCGDLVEAEEEQGITEFPMPRKTWRNLINAAEISGRDLCYLKTQTESASISLDWNDIYFSEL